MMSPATTRWVWPCLPPSMSTRTIVEYPSRSEPQSPRKIDAGLKLCGRKPRHAPISAIPRTICWAFRGSLSQTANETAMMVRPSAAMAVTPLSSPSSPSVRFDALQAPRTKTAMMAVPVQ